MCCFAGPVEFVSNTKIFARLTTKKSQFIAYQMRFKTKERNAMILPLPAEPGASESSIRFIDLSEYGRFFDDMAKGFPILGPPMPMSRGFGGAIESAADTIEVHTVGGFEASFVPKMSDFQRLDPRFVISADVWSKIPIYHDYSFAVFQLKDLQGETHPMAFEFNTRLPDTIFFPTVHIHDGEVHEEEDFHHTLYSQHAGYDAAAGDRYTGKQDETTLLTRSKSSASEFMNVTRSKGLVDGRLLVHRKKLRSKLPNRDIWLAARGNPTRPDLGMRLRRSVSFASAMLPFAWILRRRNELADIQDNR